jgi:hypothetical protein
MRCECNSEFLSVSVTPLPGGKQHVQVNCLNCGSGWGEVVDEPQPVVADPEVNDDEE